jgi:hypothetical protein
MKELLNRMRKVNEEGNNDAAEKREQRYQELYDKAVRRYLDKSDFNPSDWLDEEEAKEYSRLADN